jgi:hypothetical protein
VIISEIIIVEMAAHKTKETPVVIHAFLLRL